MTVTRTIYADKEGMLAHLNEYLEELRGTYSRSSELGLTRVRQAEYRGQIRGLEYAISSIEDWEILPTESKPLSDEEKAAHDFLIADSRRLAAERQYVTEQERRENEEDVASRRGEDLLDGPADWDEDE